MEFSFIRSGAWLAVAVVTLAGLGCGGAASNPTGTSASPTAQPANFQIVVDSYTPASGATIDVGTSFSIGYTISGPKNLAGGVAFIRDDGRDLMMGCGGGSGSWSSGATYGVMQGIHYEFAKGHTINAAVLAAKYTGNLSEWTCPFWDSAQSSRVLWDKVDSRVDVPLNWKVN